MLFANLLPIFAQNRGGPNNADVDAAVAGATIVFAVLYIAFILVAIVFTILFLLSLYQALSACSARNRTMEPTHVWLSLVPLVGIVFYILAIIKVPESFQNEYDDRGLREEGDFGKSLGIWFIITSFLCPGVNLILMFLYWAKIREHTKELSNRPAEFDDDDRRSRRSRRRDDDAG
jgi:magnesium-transporting ATPase (P-type)